MKRVSFSAASLVLLVAGIAVGGVGCSSVSAQAPMPPLDGTTWVLHELPDRPLLLQSPPTLQFADGRASGSDGCNRYSGAYTVAGGTLKIGPLAGTQMACAPESMEQARAVTDALTGATAYRIQGDKLDLLGADGNPVARWLVQSTSLAGTSWNARSINNGKGAVASLVAGTEVTLDFDRAGRAAGTAGCNRYTASYEGSGHGAFKIGPAAATRMMCAAPGVMEQEQAYLNALTTVASARIEGDRLELRTADGALAASYVRAAGRP